MRIITPTLMTLAVVLGSREAQADSHPYNQLNRFFGLGWGRGYHLETHPCGGTGPVSCPTSHDAALFSPYSPTVPQLPHAPHGMPQVPRVPRVPHATPHGTPHAAPAPHVLPAPTPAVEPLPGQATRLWRGPAAPGRIITPGGIVLP